MRILNSTDNPNQLSLKGKLIFLFKDLFFFGGLKAISLVFPFVTIPILTRYLSVEDYGFFDSLSVISGFLTLFLVLGQDSAVARWFYQVEDLVSRKKVISESLVIQLIFIFLVVTILLIFNKQASYFYFNNPDLSKYFVIIIIHSAFLLLINFTVNILKWTFDRRKFAILSVLEPFLLFCSLLSVVFFKLNLYNYLILNLLSSIISAFTGLFFCSKWLLFSKEIKFLKKLFIYGAPLGVISSISAFMPLIDRKIIIDFLGMENLGIYGLAYKIAGFILILDGIFHMAWGPFSLSIFKEKDAERIYNIVLKAFTIIMVFFIVILLAFSDFLIKIMATNEYLLAKPLLLPLLFALLFRSLGFVTDLGIGLALKSHLNIIPFLLSIAILLILLHLLVPVYKLEGVAYSLLITNFIRMIMVSIVAKKIYKPVQFNFQVLFSTLALFSVAYYIIFWFILNIFLQYFLTGIAFLLFVYLNIDKKDRMIVKSKLRSLKIVKY